VPKVSEASVKQEIRRRGGAIKVKTIHPNPANKNQYARIYVVRKKGPRGGKTVRGPIVTGQVNTQGTTSAKRGS
jgi:hypothetical protein